MTGIKKDRNTLYITHRAELLFWLIILLVVILISNFFYMRNIKNANDYNIYMQDVDGLIVGSPVRIMGIEVGHVTKIKPTNEEVYIKFVITDENITVPQGTVATVEFSGMAGSKSLELYLPDDKTYIDKTTPILTVNPPKRLHDAIGLLNDMFDKLNSIIYTSSSFGKKIKFMEIKGGNDEDIQKFLDYSNELLDDANKKAEDFGKKINGAAENGKT